MHDINKKFKIFKVRIRFKARHLFLMFWVLHKKCGNEDEKAVFSYHPKTVVLLTNYWLRYIELKPLYVKTSNGLKHLFSLRPLFEILLIFPTEQICNFFVVKTSHVFMF